MDLHESLLRAVKEFLTADVLAEHHKRAQSVKRAELEHVVSHVQKGAAPPPFVIPAHLTAPPAPAAHSAAPPAATVHPAAGSPAPDTPPPPPKAPPPAAVAPLAAAPAAPEIPQVEAPPPAHPAV